MVSVNLYWFYLEITQKLPSLIQIKIVIIWIIRDKENRFHKSNNNPMLEISPSGYHQHRQRRRISQGKPSGRISNDALLAHIKAIHVQFKGEYGWPRVWKELLANGVRVGKERLRRLMAQNVGFEHGQRLQKS
jgi:hypothetical protein